MPPLRRGLVRPLHEVPLLPLCDVGLVVSDPRGLVIPRRVVLPLPHGFKWVEYDS